MLTILTLDDSVILTCIGIGRPVCLCCIPHKLGTWECCCTAPGKRKPFLQLFFSSRGNNGSTWICATSPKKPGTLHVAWEEGLNLAQVPGPIPTSPFRQPALSLLPALLYLCEKLDYPYMKELMQPSVTLT